MDLDLELFVDDLPRSLAFYTEVLGFRVRKHKEEGYVALANGRAAIALNRRDSLPPSHPIYARPGEPLGRGVEIALVVDDVEATCRQVIARGWPLSSELTRQPWGATDFRILDPDGYYIRISDRQERFDEP